MTRDEQWHKPVEPTKERGKPRREGKLSYYVDVKKL